MTVIKFLPSVNAPFTFQCTLDGNGYLVSVTWNIAYPRWFFSVYDLNNNLILSLPLIGSPEDFNLPITAGYFTDQIIYRAPSAQFEIYNA